MVARVEQNGRRTPQTIRFTAGQGRYRIVALEPALQARRHRLIMIQAKKGMQAIECQPAHGRSEHAQPGQAIAIVRQGTRPLHQVVNDLARFQGLELDRPAGTAPSAQDAQDPFQLFKATPPPPDGTYPDTVLALTLST